MIGEPSRIWRLFGDVLHRVPLFPQSNIDENHLWTIIAFRAALAIRYRSRTRESRNIGCTSKASYHSFGEHVPTSHRTNSVLVMDDNCGRKECNRMR